MTLVKFTPSLEHAFTHTPSLKVRIEHVTAAYFPDILSVKFGRASKKAYYDPNTGTVRLTPRCSHYVIGHELMHHVQHTIPGYPGGEVSCDVFLFARGKELVPDFWGSGDVSYLGTHLKLSLLKQRYTKERGQSMIHEVCKEAVSRRASGKGKYMQWAKDEINSRIDGDIFKY